MILYDFLTSKLMPIFCDLSTVILEIGDFVITGKTVFDGFFYVAICFAVIMFAVVLPYRFFYWLAHGCTKWGSKRK